MNIIADHGKDLEWARQLRDLVDTRGDAVAAGEIDRAAAALEADCFVLAVLGKAKRGKSTLLNALLGRRDDAVAPIDKLPASSAISRIRWAEAEQATVAFRDGRRENIPFSRIRHYVTEEYNKENFKGVDALEISGPFSGLDHDLELVDTPGAGSIHEHHDAILHAFIPLADAVIFLVSARMPLDQDELELLHEVQAADVDKIFFVINRVDESSEQDVEDAIAHNIQLLQQIGVHVEKFHRISAKKAFQGDLEGSGVAALMAEIGQFLAHNKGRVLAERFQSRIRAAVQPVCQALAVQITSSRKTASELETELAKLREQKRAIESDRCLVEREFGLAWTRAADAYEQAVRQAKGIISSDLAKKISGTPQLDVTKLAKQLPTILRSSLDDELIPIAKRFEESARQACEKLQIAYPELSMGDFGEVVVRTNAGTTAITGSVGGVAAAATGIGLAAAGSAAATSIAAANAVALAATTTVAAPSVISGVLSVIPQLSILAPLATGSATVACPAAVTAMPLWVAMAGPVGWTLAGIGVLAVPFSWRVSKLRLKDKLAEATDEHIKTVFCQILEDKITAIRRMEKGILEEVRIGLDRQLGQIESAIVSAKDHRPTDEELKRLTGMAERLHGLLAGGSAPKAASSLLD